MYTAMYQFKDQYGRTYYRSVRLGGYRYHKSAINAIKRVSPKQTGFVQIGQTLVSIVSNGVVTTVNSLSLL